MPDELAALRAENERLREEMNVLRFLLTSKYKFILQQTGECLVWFRGENPHLCSTLDKPSHMP